MRTGGARSLVPIALALLGACQSCPPGLPTQWSDAAFWQMANGFSEPDGVYEAANLVSNEATLQRVLPQLAERVPIGGVYLGVGPEQNFTLLAALRPRLAFVVDIRRQNFVLHLFYKALFELAVDRADFLRLLFARAMPDDVPGDASVDMLLQACQNAAPDAALHRRVLLAVRAHLTQQHGFPLDAADLASLEHVVAAFHAAGPELRYDAAAGERAPTFAELMTASDGLGMQRSFLASAESFQAIVFLHRHNAIVPVVGDFAGPSALRAIGRLLASHGALVDTFYLSNVELFLFRSDAWQRFYATLGELPLDGRSTAIRAVSGRGLAVRGEHDEPGIWLRSLDELRRAFAAGRIAGYFDVLAMPR